MAVGMFLFSAVDTLAKFLTDTLHPLQIVWIRQLGLVAGTILLMGICGVRIFMTAHPVLQLARGSGGRVCHLIYHRYKLCGAG